MNDTQVCEHARAQAMAALDGPAGPPSPETVEHLAACPSCRHWLAEMTSLAQRLDGLPYGQSGVDLWPRVEAGIQFTDEPVLKRLLPVAAVVIAWRTVQLAFDLPLPMLHPIVPLGAAFWAIRRVGVDPFAIETTAPELQKRGI